jgi:oligoendopeptidase F
MKTTLLFPFIFILIFMISTAIFAQEKKIPDYSLTDRKDIPVDYTWKIEDIYPSMEAWKTDKEAAVELISKIDETAAGWTSSSSKMLALLDLLNEINLKSSKLFSFASHQANTDMSNTQYQSMQGELQSIFVQMSSKLSFLNPDIIALGYEKFGEYVTTEPKLEIYRFMAEDIFRSKDHILPEDQQKIASLTGLFSGSTNRAANMLNDMELPSAEVTLSTGQKVILNYANYMKYRASKITADRRMVMNEFWKNQKKFENTLAILQDGAIKQHLFSSKIGKYPDCLSAKLFGDNIPKEVYLQLIKSVKENLSPMHRYLKLKKELLGLDKYLYEDIYASAVPSVEKVFTFDEAEQTVLEIMKPMGNEYQDALKLSFDNRWIDIYPNKGKQSGAYSGGIYGVHPFVKINYDGSYNAISTLAHEIGHAMHSYFSNKYQPLPLSGYTIFLAEIASTFNENMLMDYLLKNDNDDMFKLFVLDSYLDQVRGTLYRQTLFAEFELAMHERVESGQTLTADWLNNKYLELTREYYGHDEGVCEVGDYIQNEWSRIPHFYMNYYVFQYSTGIIASMALSDYVLNNPAEYRDKYLTMLKSGGNDYPMEILKKAGVDMTQPEPYSAAFNRFDRMVSEMEKIVSKLKEQKKL